MDSDLRAYFRILRKRKWYAIGTFVVFVVLGALFTARQTPIYQAQASLFVGQPQISEQDLKTGVVVTALSEQLLKSYAQIITSRSIAERAVAASGLPLSPGQVRAGLKAEAVLDTLVINLTFRGPDPELAQRTVNAVADAFVANIGQLGAKQAAIPVNIIDRATVPTSPVSPNPARNLTLAALLGLALGTGLAFGVDFFDTTVKHREDLERLGLPVLGSIPALDTHGAEVYLERDPQGLGGESFRKLRTTIGFLGVEAPLRTILVTSTSAQEGKTTVSLNLAAAFAHGGLRTLLVEADLRRPSLHRIFGTRGTDGLTTAIIGRVTAAQACSATDVTNLSVMLAGAIPPNPVELLGSEQMQGLLARLRANYDVIVIDSPPLLPVADPATLAARCDGTIIVARAGRTDRRKLVESARTVERSGARFLGIVLNFLKPSEAPYEYVYYYSYRSEAEARVADAAGP